MPISPIEQAFNKYQLLLFFYCYYGDHVYLTLSCTCIPGTWSPTVILYVNQH